MQNAVPKAFRTPFLKSSKTKTKTKYLKRLPAWSSSKEVGEKFSINRRLTLRTRPRHLIERLEEILITETQARILAALLNEIRPRWAIPSMLKALEKQAQHPARFADIASAAVAAARDPAVATPGLFFTDTRFWPEEIKHKLPRPPECEDHTGQDMVTCRSCKADVLCGDRPPDMIGKHWEQPNIEAVPTGAASAISGGNDGSTDS